MALFFRRDDWVQDAMGNAISGANVYVTSQPTNTGHVDEDTGLYIPPSPLVQLYADPHGMTPLAQPVQTDGYGHAFYYATANVYTVTYYSGQIGQTTLLDQTISGAVSPINTSPPSGAQDGTNRVFTLPSTPTNFLMLFSNGVLQLPGTNYVIAGAVATYAVAPQPTDQLFAVYQ